MLDKPDSEQLEDFVLHEGVDDPELLKKIIRAWGEIRCQGRSESGKRNCIEKQAYTQWVKDVLFPFPPEPSMSIKPHELAVFPTSKVYKLKETIKVL